MKWLLILYLVMLTYLVALFTVATSHANAELVKWSFFSFLAALILADIYKASKGKE